MTELVVDDTLVAANGAYGTEAALMALEGADIKLSPITFTALTPNLYRESVANPLLIRYVFTKPVEGTSSMKVVDPVPLSH